MPDFIVSYHIELSADNPVEAARLAHKWMQDRESCKPVLQVVNEAGVETTVDLEEVDSV